MTGLDLTLTQTSLSVQDGLGLRTIFSTDGLHVPAGTLTAVRGASGAGKSTFLKLISGILLPTRGEISWGETVLTSLSEARRDAWRGTHVGFLFQDFRLFDGLTAIENVLLPFTFRERITPELRARASSLLEAQGVRPDTASENLSRGEMQRTALVRVLMRSPAVILADEPTASLDAVRAAQAADALIEAAGTLGATLILVSHDERILSRFSRTLELQNGILTEKAAQ